MTAPRLTGWTVVAGYLAATLLMTWPLMRTFGTSVAADYGDAVFITWVMAWVDAHLTDVLRGNLQAWPAMWDAPIFAPERNTLAYSEHFIGQSLQALPLYWLTGNPLVAFNAVFVATVALTGVAAHRLAYDWSGRHLAGAVAGLTCTFNTYRWFWSLSHLHTLSVHWWIFALWGIDRFAATGSRLALVGATLSLIALHLSSNYLMAYGAPFTALFAIWALARHGQLRNHRMWAALAASGLVSVVSVAPLLLRYLEMQAAMGFSRSLEEIVGNSTSVASFQIAMPWFGPLVALAILGTVVPVTGRWQVSRAARMGLVAMTLAAFVLSMGPVIHVGTATMTGPYRLLLDYVPGFAGLRVAQRFAAIALCLLSLLAGIGAAWLGRWRVGMVAVVLLTALVTRSAWSEPFPIDRVIGSPGLAPPPAYLRPTADAPRIYRFVRTTPPDAIVLELPFGDIGYEIRYTYFTLAHQRRSVNGYSGVLPPSFLTRQAVLRAPLADVEASWEALAPATHVVVHTGAWLDDTGTRVRDWLEQRGARVLANADGAWLYELPPN